MIFTRFKYAEEDAHRLYNHGHLFRFTVNPDVSRDEDGETYVFDEFIVEDLGPR